MSINVTEDMFIKLRSNDPSFQAISRVSDASNTYDVQHIYIKDYLRNDFESQLQLFNQNKGILHDGKHVDMFNFFKNTRIEVVDDKKILRLEENLFFKFKINTVLQQDNLEAKSKTYITKKNIEQFQNINVKVEIDPITNKPIEKKSIKDTEFKEIEYSSYPLQRMDKMIMNELPSLFIYLNGMKLPDDEIYLYCSNTGTDVFIPMKYITDQNGKIVDFNNKESHVNCRFHIDKRSNNKNCFYIRAEANEDKRIVLTDYIADKLIFRNGLKKERLDQYGIMYNNKFVIKNTMVMGFNKDGSFFTSDLNFISTPTEYSIQVQSSDINIKEKIELYILSTISYRVDYSKEREKNLKYFYIPDTKVQIYQDPFLKLARKPEFLDPLQGPISKQACYFFYQGKRLDDTLIEQVTRTAFKYNGDEEIDLDYLTFIIEDTNRNIDDYSYNIYGDDYYLLNMLGNKRSIDYLRGKNSYTIFDQPKFKPNIKQIFNENGEMFDIQKQIARYESYKRTEHSTEARIKRLLKERPHTMRNFLEELKTPFKRFTILGNDNDVSLSSVFKRKDINQTMYYKIYVNGLSLDSSQYKVDREGDFDLITIFKDILKPVKYDTEDHSKIISGINQIEIYQYDVTFRDKVIFKTKIDDTFTEILQEDGSYVYTKTFNINDLPFGPNFNASDLIAIEQVKKEWYDNSQKEYYMIYPSTEYSGFRLLDIFEIINKDENTVTIKVKLQEHAHNDGQFFILLKQFNSTVEIRLDNPDKSFMIDNDVIIPVYSEYIEYELDSNGKKVISNITKYIPYINDSEPILTMNGYELIYGKDYTFNNIESNENLTCSYVILKDHPKDHSTLVVRFNSTKTNILIVGYDNLNIDNKYGLIYLSELPYPVSTEYMNIYVNGMKLSKYNIDILSDKLIRIHNFTRPITSILILTNLLYKHAEIEDYLSIYKPSQFEDILKEVFWNCDPSRLPESNKENIDYIYKMSHMYNEFNKDIVTYDKDNNKKFIILYEYLIEKLKEKEYNFDRYTSYRTMFKECFNVDIDYPPNVGISWTIGTESFAKHEILSTVIQESFKKFFEIYKHNHGFFKYVDSVEQAENTYKEKEEEKIYEIDLLEIMYVNWLCTSGKTRSYAFPDMDIDKFVLQYFSIFENFIINNRIDIRIDPGKMYKGLIPDAVNLPIVYDYKNNPEKPIYQYPGAQIDLRRRYFYNILLTVIENNRDKKYFSDENGLNNLMKDICDHQYSNILYPRDFPLVPDKNGIWWTGTNVDIVVNENKI